ncbi:hypothetical protein UT300005_05610 [Clostridium sp. CTA-5]
MEKEEFIMQAKKLGYSKEIISEIIKNHEQAEKNGIKMSYEIELENLPVSY